MTVFPETYQSRFAYHLKRKRLLRKLVEININIVRRLFVDVQSNRKRHKEISEKRWLNKEENWRRRLLRRKGTQKTRYFVVLANALLLHPCQKWLSILICVIPHRNKTAAIIIGVLLVGILCVLVGTCVTFEEAEKSYQSDRLSLEKFFPHFFVYLRRF